MLNRQVVKAESATIKVLKFVLFIFFSTFILTHLLFVLFVFRLNATLQGYDDDAT